MACSNCMAGMLKCSFGAAPSTLMVLPVNMVIGPAGPIANIIDNKPFMNILPFGVCITLSNPAVAAATAAALGVLTPMPCVPVTPGPWVPTVPMVIIKNMPILDQASMLMCAWGGVITTTFPGQVKVIAS